MSALDTQVGGTHYKDCKIQPVEFIEANRLQFLEASVVKRMCRHDKPSGKGRQDIEKAIHELQLLLQLRYTVIPPTPQVTSSSQGCKVCGNPMGHSGLPCPNMVMRSLADAATSIGSCGSSQMESTPGCQDRQRPPPLVGTSLAQD